jgi:hypothetical protein
MTKFTNPSAKQLKNIAAAEAAAAKKPEVKPTKKASK